MLTGPDVDGWHRTICPACGYPSAGVCAACRQIPPAAVDPAMNTVAGVSHFNPAA
jgi:hypothetical protein